MQHPLEELLETVSGKTAYFVIDNLDRLFNESSFRNLSIFLKILNLDKQDSPWRILLTCQSQELKRISDKLRSLNVPTSNWHIINMESPIYTMKNDFWYDPNDEIRKRLARLLNFYWQNDQLAVQQSQNHWDAFKRLLKILVQKQNSIALELSELISSETTK